MNPVPTSGAAPAPAKTKPVGGASGPGPSNAARSLVPACVIFAIVAGIYYVGASSHFSARQSWILILILLLTLCGYLGATISSRPLGILVGPRNLMSLSRCQIVAWSIVILSGLLTIAFRRILGHVSAPLDIGMDENLWALMGISTASLVGTPLILQNKARQDPHPRQVESAANALGEPRQEVEDNREGKLYANPSIGDARLTDIFEGDEIGNTAYIDVSKLQMFLFTMITIVAYCSDIYAALGQSVTPDKLAMPALSQGLIALLGISHAGYLASKTADHTPTPANP